jgi:hypothetical protein
VDRLGRAAARVDLDDLAADHALADDLHAGVGADEVAQLAVEAQPQHHVAAGRRRRLDRLDLPGLDPLDTDASPHLDAVDLPKADSHVEGIAPEPLPAADREQARANQGQAEEDDGGEDDRL